MEPEEIERKLTELGNLLKDLTGKVDGLVLNNNELKFPLSPQTIKTITDVISNSGLIRLLVSDGIDIPATRDGYASIYIDSADGDLKIKFSDGFVGTIAADS